MHAFTSAQLAGKPKETPRAPRRTGKSAFVREHLRPALTALGALVLYVDLWADTTAASVTLRFVDGERQATLIQASIRTP